MDDGKQNKPRQQPGLACEACRQRKLRCDRQEPTCGTCQDLDIVCVPNTTRAPRGPKKGHLRALQSRIDALERRVNDNNVDPNADCQSPLSAVTRLEADLPNNFGGLSSSAEDSGYSSSGRSSSIVDKGDMAREESQQAFAHSRMDSSSPLRFYNDFASSTDFAALMQAEFGDIPLPSPAQSPTEPFVCHPRTGSCDSGMPQTFMEGTAIPLINDLMRADLNHLYFDRVHSFAPFLNKRRYFARAAKSSGTSEPFTCLQHAMWTLAAAMGSQFQPQCRTFYAQTRQMLEAWELEIMSETVAIEQAQAWILLAMYEIAHVNYQRGWISAGRCFRLVQLMKLHEIDGPKAAHSGRSWVEEEERRRTFWAAYSLDRFINLINQLPLTLSEQVILTRLPAPEQAFQRDQPVQTGFLSEVIATNLANSQSTFTDAIIFVTISGRCLAHQQQCNVERAYGTSLVEDFVTRHKWLGGILFSKLQRVPSYKIDDEAPDAMPLFTAMAAYSAALLLCMTMQSFQNDLPEHQDLVAETERRAIMASQQIVSLSQQIAHFNYFKVHPLMSIPLYFCAEFLRPRGTLNARFRPKYQAMVDCLRNLSTSNRLAGTCLMKLEIDENLHDVFSGDVRM